MSDDRELRPTPILASDPERERCIALLRDAVVEGRLTLEEFSDRAGLAYAARTDQDLARLARDLPGELARFVSPAADPEAHMAFCSHLVRGGPWSLPSRSSWRSIFGTIDLDLRQVRLTSRETILKVSNLFGTVTVIVPEGIEVVVRGGGLFASQKIECPQRPPIAGGKSNHRNSWPWRHAIRPHTTDAHCAAARCAAAAQPHAHGLSPDLDRTA